MAGYTRQSAADIVPTAVVRAAPINNEFNAVVGAFSTSTGHKHDGTAAEGAPVPLIADADSNNKVVIDTSNNRVGVFVEVSSSAVEQVRIQDGAIVPVTDDDIDLGTAALQFKDLYIDGVANIDSLVADTADINGGTIDNAVIGGATPAAATFTTANVNSSATIASADINAGTIDGVVIGGASAQAITGTLITASTGFSGPLTGQVTGNVTGDLTGNVTGNVTGDLTGNVTAASGTSTFNNVTIAGTLDMDGATAATIVNLSAPTNTGDAATKGYVDTSISALVDSAPGALDTLNELAAALGDDANFSTTVTNSIATKLPLAGGTMTGAIAMGTNKITGLGDPTNTQDAATKTYVDTADGLKLSLSGGTMTGALDMGANNITTTHVPSGNSDVTNKLYIDTLFGSTVSAANSAAAAATSASEALISEGNAEDSAIAAALSETAALGHANNAEAAFDSLDDRYLGAKSSPPALDNDGDALLTGALYFDTVDNELYVWNGSSWIQAAFTTAGFLTSANNLSDLSNAATARQNLDLEVGVDVQAFDADTAKLDVTQTFTAQQTFVSPILGTPASGNLENCTFPTLNQNTTGTAANVTGTVAVANGGTGLTTLTANNVVIGNGTSAVQFVAPGTSGNLLTSNGTTWTSAAPAPGGIEYEVKTANYTAADKEGILADTSGGAFTITLPATPATGAQVIVADPAGNWGTNNLTIGRNGETIADVAEDLVCDISGVSVQLVYDGTTWAVYAQVGGNGGTVVTEAGAQTLTNKTINLSSNTLVATSAQLAAALTDETGTGVAVFGTNPTLTGVTLAGEAACADNLVTRATLKDYAIEGSAIGNAGATRTFDLSVANFFSVTIDQATTFTFSNPPASGDFGAFVMEITNGAAFVITFPASVDWPGGTAPTLTASGKDQLVFTTRDGGTTYFGFVAGLDIKSP